MNIWGYKKSISLKHTHRQQFLLLAGVIRQQNYIRNKKTQKTPYFLQKPKIRRTFAVISQKIALYHVNTI